MRTCNACGEEYYEDHDYCQGKPHERIDALETEVRDLKRLVVVLLSGRTVPADELEALIEECDLG